MPTPNSLSVASGSKNFSGYLTSITAVPGDTLVLNGLSAVVATFVPSTQTGTLAKNWPGSTLTDQIDNWSFLKTGDYWNSVVTATAKLTDYLDKISKGIPFKPDRAGPLSDRATFDTQKAGFAFLRTDVDPGLLYLKRTDASGDWTAGVALKGDAGATAAQGPPGQANSLSVGSVSVGTAAVTITGASPSQIINFVLPQGPQGNTGPAPNLTIGSVVPGSVPSVTLGGSNPNYVLNFTLVPGSVGPAGPPNSLSIGSVTSGTASASISGAAPNQTLNLVLPPGIQGIPGPTGPSVNFTVGTVNTGTASVTISGTTPNYVLNFVVPQGIQGDPGPPPTLSIGSVTSGSSPSVTITGAPGTYALNFVLQIGPTGPPPNLAIGTTFTGAPGTSAIVTLTGTTPNYNVNFTVPRGDPGAQGYTPALTWTFVSATGDSDPGPGAFKFDNADINAATFLYANNADFLGAPAGGWLDSLDDANSTTDRGRLLLLQFTDLTQTAYLQITGSVVAGTGYRKIPITLLAGFPVSGRVIFSFAPTGPAGTGIGDVIGPNASVNNNIPTFNGTSGKLLGDSGHKFGVTVPTLAGTNPFSGPNNFGGSLDAQQDFRWSGDISPPTLSGDVDDYNPSNWGISSTLKLTTSGGAPRHVKGLVGGVDGRIAVIMNNGPDVVILQNEAPSSVPGNRFAFPGDIQLGAKDSTVLQYDAVSSRWRYIAGGAVFTMAGRALVSVAATPPDPVALAIVFGS
jgi:hypothetical protein